MRRPANGPADSRGAASCAHYPRYSGNDRGGACTHLLQLRVLQAAFSHCVYGTVHVPRCCQPLVAPRRPAAFMKMLLSPANSGLKSTARLSISMVSVPPTAVMASWIEH